MLLEAIFFPQGTYFLKVHPLKNLYRIPLSEKKPTGGVTPQLTYSSPTKSSNRFCSPSNGADTRFGSS